MHPASGVRLDELHRMPSRWENVMLSSAQLIGGCVSVVRFVRVQVADGGFADAVGQSGAVALALLTFFGL